MKKTNPAYILEILVNLVVVAFIVGAVVKGSF